MVKKNSVCKHELKKKVLKYLWIMKNGFVLCLTLCLILKEGEETDRRNKVNNLFSIINTSSIE